MDKSLCDTLCGANCYYYMNNSQMRFTTSIRAIDPHTGELCLYNGPVIEANSWEQAQFICDNNAMGYCVVDGIFKGEQLHILWHELN